MERDLCTGRDKDDVYKPHSFEEVKALVAPEVAARLDPSLFYGLWWFNRKRTVCRQIVEDKAEGKVYRHRTTTTKRPPSEWIAVPVPDSGISREVVDAARVAMKNNLRPSNAGRRLWELSGGIARCGGCGRRMISTSIKSGNGRTKRYFYYRCPKQQVDGPKPCPDGPKTVPAEKVEAEVWEAVSGLLKDPKTLRADLDAMVESERIMCADPEREAKAWAEKLTAADRKRSRYQDMAAEGLITFDELREKLVVLEETRKSAERELEALQGKQDRIAKLEQDRDALLDSLVEIGAEALDALSPDERNQLYRILQLKVVLNKDAMPELSGVFGQGLDVCTLESQP